MATICRLCATLKKVENFVNIQDTNQNLCLKLEKCCQLVIFENDGLPKNVCTDCLKIVNDFWVFFQKVHETQESLSEIFVSTKSESSPVPATSKPVENSKEQKNDNSTVAGIQCVSVKTTDDGLQEYQFEIERSDATNDESIVIEDDESTLEGKVEYDKSHTEEWVTTEFELEENVAVEYGNEGSAELLEDELKSEYFLEEEKCEEETEEEDERNISMEFTIVNYDEEKIVHSSSTWEEYLWKCSVCSASIEGYAIFVQHMETVHKTEEDKTNFVCLDCSKVFEKYYMLINHVKTTHRRHLQLCCDICSQIFADSKSFAQHRNDHQDSEAKCRNFFACNTCGRAFLTANALQVHSKCHLPAKDKYKFECDVCKKKFTTNPNFKAHFRIHTGEKEFTCDNCGKCFNQKANLEEHQLIHISDAPYTCELCFKGFKTPARLTRHKITHSNSRPYECKDCGKSFREKVTLNIHQRIHTGDQPYECEFCSRRFRFRSVMMTHRNVHTGHRPYKCEECQRDFTNWPNYNKHMKRMHNTDTSSVSRQIKRAMRDEQKAQHISTKRSGKKTQLESEPEPETQTSILNRSSGNLDEEDSDGSVHFVLEDDGDILYENDKF